MVIIVNVHEEDYLYVIKHAGYNESFADTLRRLVGHFFQDVPEDLAQYLEVPE